MSASGRAFVAPTIGTSLGPYRLEAELGHGAAGVVFRARHAVTGAPAAVKVVSTGAGELAERFAREVESLARLRHANVVAIHAAGTGDGFGWLAMDLVEGASLDRILARHERTPRQLVDLVAQVARGVAHAHERGVVHRDLKPQNVLVTPEGVARVTDFGLAKHMGRETRLTETSAFMGTPNYMSPEQALGRGAHADERSDVWAAGVMLYEATTGTLPFQGDSLIAVCRAIIDLEPDRPRSRAPGLDPDLESIMLRALEKTPARRYATMEALARDLERHLRGERVLVSGQTPGLARLRRLGQPGIAGAIGLVGLAIAGVAGLAAHAREAGRDQAAREDVARAGARIESEGRSAADRLAAGSAGTLDVAGVASRELGRLARAEDELVAASSWPGAQDEVRAQAARLAVSPARARLALVLARALARLGETGAARAELDAASRAGVRDVALETARGELALGEEDLPGALDAFARAVALDPRAGDALLGAVRARARAAPPSELLALEREVDRVESERLALPGAVTLARATVLAALGKDTSALALLKDPAGALAPALLLLKARILRAQEAEPAARACLVAAALLDPAAGRAAAREDHELGATADEARLLESVVQLEPDDVRATVALAELRGCLGELDAGVLVLRRGLAQLERTEAGRARSGLALAALGPLELASHAEAAPEAARPGDRPEEASPIPARANGPAAALALARATPRPGRSQILEAALERSGPGSDLARVAAELAAEETAAGHADAAGRLVQRALALDPRCERALDLEAARLALAGDLAGAVRTRAAAEAARPEASRRAFREGQADALAFFDGVEQGERVPPPDGSPGARRLASRATAELSYAAELSPGAGAPRGILAHLALALGNKSRAHALAQAALDADPLDTRAAIVLLAAADSAFAGDEVRATGAALATAPWPQALELATLRARRALGSRERAIADEIATGLFRDHADDRKAVTLALDVWKATSDPRERDARERLASIQARLARAHEKVQESERLVSRDERVAALAAALAAVDLAEDEPSTIEAAEKCERTLHRVDAGPARSAPDPAPLEPLARCLLRRTIQPSDAVRHASALAEDLGADSLARARERIETAPDARERLVRQTALALLLGGNALNRLDARARLATTLPITTAREGLAAIEPVLEQAPEAISAYAVRALQLSRAARRESAARDLDRVLLRRTPGLGEHQVAAMVLVLADDLPAASREAILGISLARSGDDASRAFLAEPPFSSIADQPAWSQVRARLGR